MKTDYTQLKNYMAFAALVLIAAFSFPYETRAQVTMGTNASPKAFSVLELHSNAARGLRMPQVNTANRTDITVVIKNMMANTNTAQAKADSIAALGLTVYNTTNKTIEFWNGRDWLDAKSREKAK